MPHTSPKIHRALAGVAALPLVIAVGCSGPVKTAQSGPEPRAYPFAPGQSEVHDIQVFRDGTRLKLTNTTAGSFGPGTLWVNRRFSAPVSGLGIGESLNLDLYDFVDQFGDSFRAGGFFAKQAPDPVVLVQFESASDDVMHGFVLVRDDIN